ncbi:MAG: hypothetical protein NZ530_03265 [Thermodesulfobacteriaceae bacterium]|nr:hypothetical protein [Thermodesulfobacteriaceae bacterium]MCX8041660.1 hypothetical protein [Thermodesulfobacteriaceae bacterium]MDW8135312.1 hypothetical protein [Thermodesulfobacterium sp.]
MVFLGKIDDSWENIIWREWRNCEDRIYAQKLFELVAEKPVKVPLMFILIIIIGFYFGLIGGLLTGNLVINSKLLFYPEKWQLVWDIKFILGGILTGIGLGLLLWVLTLNLWTWRHFLSFMIPKVDPSVLFIGPIIVGIIYAFFYGPFIKIETNFLNLFNFNLANPLLGSLFGGLFGVLMGGMVIGLVYGTLGGLCGGIIIELFSSLSGYTPFSKISEELRGGLVLGVVFEFFFGLTLGVFYLLWTWISKGENLKWIDYGRSLWVWWRKRPMLSEVEKALHRAWSKEWIQTLFLLEKNKREFLTPELLISNLESENWQERFMARHLLLYLGGEGINLLVKRLSHPSSVKNTILHLLKSIAYETEERLASKANWLICPKCMVHLGANQIRLDKKVVITFYGCRSCYQSRNFYNFRDNKIVMILDRELEEEKILEDKILRINWFKHKELFDFDWIEIFQASDEEVERFCIHIGNDGDLIRRKKYKKIPCFIRKECELKEETINMLRNIFKEVVFKEF